MSDHAAFDRLRAEEQLRRNHETFYGLIHDSPFGVYIVDAEFRLIEVSAGARPVFRGIDPLLGRDFAEILHIVWAEPFASQAVNLFRHTLETGQPYRAPDTTERRANVDAVESYDWMIKRITLPNGTWGVACYFYDATRVREAEQALRDSDRRKNEFLAVLSHELRNPLGPLGNGLYLAENSPPGSPAMKRGLEVARRQFQQLTRLVDDLLDVNRIATGKIRIDVAPVELAALLRRVVEDHRMLLGSRGIELTLDAGEEPGARDEPVWVSGDAARLAQAFGNLLHNANKFTDAGGRVTVRLRAPEREAVVEVTDTGVGMDAEEAAHVFEPFVQSARTTQRTSGLGLGLALVKGIVERHGGTVIAESAGPGQGSRFALRLPRIDPPHRESSIR